MTIKHLYTNRTRLRPLTLDDADFIFELVTDPAWLKYIGDKGVHNKDDAKNYILSGPLTLYKQYGFGLLVVETLEHATPLGLCGLLQRNNLNMPDIGFAFLAQQRGKGYALEAAEAVINHALVSQEFDCVAGITAKNNAASIALLNKLGFVFNRTYFMNEADSGSNLFTLTKTAWAK